ncbi:hypothetical protein F5Y01DRAFT_79303 [Xylaria sp. FL0043]|nr:hypothetical protein F5Y01DRAFT_79303 [Xylaria sp. FL0043]
MEDQPDVEILVHIGAPSRAVHDAQYRSLAAAYLAFEPTGIVHFSPGSGHDSSSNSSQGGRLEPWVADDEESFIPLSDERTAPFRSPQASFRSVVDNADSPRMRVRVREMPENAFIQQTPVSATQATWQTPPSVVQDSHPMNHADFSSLTSPTRVLENYLQYFESPSCSPRRDSQNSRLRASRRRASRHNGRRLSPRNMVPCTPQMIPCTPPVQSITEPSSASKGVSESQASSQPKPPEVPPVDPVDDNIIEETTFLSSPQVSALTRADSEPLPKKRRLELATESHALARTTSDIGPRSFTDHKTSVTVSFLSSHGFTYESLEIRSPEPPTAESYIGPEELITPGLQKLGHDVGLPSRFRPKEQTRELTPYERGYWLLDCSSWDAQLKRNAWAFLANYIGTGIAGWGVWCKRDDDFRELKAYCWGAVVAHIYYVLWLSSHREIVFTGSSWADAEGAKVIAMGSRSRPQR